MTCHKNPSVCVRRGRAVRWGDRRMICPRCPWRRKTRQQLQTSRRLLLHGRGRQLCSSLRVHYPPVGSLVRHRRPNYQTHNFLSEDSSRANVAHCDLGVGYKRFSVVASSTSHSKEHRTLSCLTARLHTLAAAAGQEEHRMLFFA